ncbi:Uncharacterized protein M6B38_225565 [Iris pallida]|uniref:Fungal lipase-type domain-containing protein n=1 Tax=Iris pallida TaxID=29817 RepID=A0AAX6DV50_IRIPA|nr:Uncharacterized protein M6B38_225565 [Iris pallida]
MDALQFATRVLPPPRVATVSHHAPAVQVTASAVPRADPSDAVIAEGRRKGNWVLKILRVNSIWAKEREEETEKDVSGLPVSDMCPGCSEGCGVGGGDDPEGPEEVKSSDFDRSKFSKLLRRVSMVELEVYAKLSYLGILAYNIPKIKPVSLLKHHGLRFVTSSLEKKAQSSNAEKEELPEKDTKQNEPSPEVEEDGKLSKSGYRLSPSAAYDVAASAASYLQSQTRSFPLFRNWNVEADQAELDNASGDQEGITSSDMASFVATTNSVTAMVAGKEEMKEAVAKDLNSAQSSPCEWFICDDDERSTRYFVIQGSESLASWQANLLFEPIQFEGLEVLVHRGIYEAAKGIYQQMLPEVRSHLESRGSSATLRFTGHSLGGSLSLLVNLMLLIRGEAQLSALLPVITFGAPTIMCGGDYLLRKLGLPQSHVQAITMHRDIVPRVFSCNYPDNVAKILRAVNGNFRNHPCLNNQKLLYAPMGKLLILQPEEKFSPYHDFLPPGSGLYLLDHSSSDLDDPMRLLRAARTAFLNTPHPLEILSDRSAYGSDGTICRDHDIQSYVMSVRRVFRQELKLVRKAKREHRRRLLWWPLVTTDQGTQSSAGLGRRVALTGGSSRHHFSFVGVLDGGRETLKRLGRIFAFRNLHMFVLLFLPARLLVIGTLTLVRLG